MKIKISIIALLTSLISLSQSQLEPGIKARDAQKSVKDGYTTNLGWQLKEGDTLQLGIGSADRQHFSYAYSSPTSFTQVMAGMDGGSNPLNYLDNDYNNMVAVVKKFGVKGTRKTGYLAYVVVGIGQLENYWIEIENAVEYGELIPPNLDHAPKYEPLEVRVVGGQTDKYDQLAKIKKLFDNGILTEKEYELEKKKILDQN